MDCVDDCLEQHQLPRRQADAGADHQAVVVAICEPALHHRDRGLVWADQAALGAPAPPGHVGEREINSGLDLLRVHGRRQRGIRIVHSRWIEADQQNSFHPPSPFMDKVALRLRTLDALVKASRARLVSSERWPWKRTTLAGQRIEGLPSSVQHHGPRSRMVPPAPTAQTSLAPLPQTPVRGFGEPLEALVQAFPSQWRMVPESPTAQTSLAPLPQMPKRACVVPLETAVQALPFQCTMTPKLPTAQTSLAPLPQTP